MNAAIVAAILTFCVIGGNADFLEKVLKPFSLGCAKSDDLKCPRADITFWLYTRATQSNGTKLNQFDLESLKKAPFVEAPLKFIVHGYSVDKDTAVNAFLRPAYFAHGEYNIISVNWSALGKIPCYYRTSLNVPTIAKCVAQFFNAVVKTRNFPSIHLLGHSMGAHIAAQASHQIPNLPRLTEFDPANPMFGDNSKLLKKGLAKFIDVYHSNCDLKGRRSRDGDLDVYYNNGMYQPGCGCATTCSHDRAVQFYAESIGNPWKMIAFPCGGWKDFTRDKCPLPTPTSLIVVGEGIDTARKGTYMMFTAAKKPFFLEPHVYTDASSFNKFKITASHKCMVFDVLTLIKNWNKS